MQIPVNKNFDTYKEDFWKGLTLSQTVCCILTLCIGTGGFLLFAFLGLPAAVSLYLTFPLAFPAAAVGFLKIGGLSLLTYLKKRRSCERTPLYRFHPMYLLLQESEETHPPHRLRSRVGRNSFKLGKEGRTDADAGL